jgi:hypothetical protein
MLEEMLVAARSLELSLVERKVAYRQELEQRQRVEKLEQKLAAARARAADIAALRPAW